MSVNHWHRNPILAEYARQSYKSLGIGNTVGDDTDDSIARLKKKTIISPVAPGLRQRSDRYRIFSDNSVAQHR